MTESEWMRALECCADRDFVRCGLCPLRSLGEDECRRRVTRAALVYVRASERRVGRILQILKEGNERYDQMENTEP